MMESGFKTLTEISNVECIEELQDILFVKRSRLDNMINCLESGAREINELRCEKLKLDKINKQLLEALELCNLSHSVSPEIAEIVENLCERNGYGAVMATAQSLWQRKDAKGCFTLGPCKATVDAAIRAAKGE